jgi:putative transposase
VSIRLSVAPVVQEIRLENTLSIDLGLNHFLIDSDGHKIDNPRFLKNSLHQLKIEQRIFARKQEKSKAREQQKTKVARLHEKVKNQRKDFNHQRTAALVKKNDTAFVVEDLNIKGMVKNRKLAGTINDVRWGQFILFLSYKCERVGKTVHKIGRYEPTSKVCSCCGYKMETMPLSVREWQYPSCQQIHDRGISVKSD